MTSGAKKIISMVLIITLVLGTASAAATNEATTDYDHAKEAYTYLNSLSGSCMTLGDALYNAYALQTLRTSYQYFDSKGKAYPYIVALTQGCDINDDPKNDELMYVYGLSEQYNPSASGYTIAGSLAACGIVEKALAYTPNECVRVIWEIFNNRGEIENILNGLELAKDSIKSTSSSYEYYEQLKMYYSTLNNYYNFLVDPNGSLVDFADTIKKYNEKIEQYEEVLWFEFI
ncbi:MAG: hypothetical protein LLF96_01785 [Eubacteriales bacterium]|nr:hypothetical protein [Eubacteriales bacterium]